MSAPGKRQLRWAFAVALALHGAALVAASCLPAQPARNSALDEIQVFDSAAPIVASPVEFVEWSEQQPSLEGGVVVPAVPEPVRPPVQRAVRRQPEPRPKPQPTPQRLPSVARQVESAPQPLPETRPAQTPRSASTGGGGGQIDLGARSSRGDLTGVPGGRTPVGGLPGAGTGSGSGTGSGDGTGTGSGDGSGHGSGEGPGTGSESGGGTASNGRQGGERQPSRVAERVEPAVTHKGTFRYPEAAAEEGVQGVVKLKVLVTEDGLVAEVEITRSSGDRRLDQAAKEWVRGWKYSPAVQAGKPRRVYTHATVEFELR